jgi:hypothetical protein
MSRLQPDIFYHIYNHANGADNLFREERNYHYFIQQWEKYILPIADTYAYCLMPNHFHALIKIKGIETLSKNEKFESILRDPTGFENLSGLISKQFGNFFNSYAKAFNKMYDRR